MWGKLLPDGGFALGFVSNENVPTDVTCDAACFGKIFDGVSRCDAGTSTLSPCPNVAVPFSICPARERPAKSFPLRLQVWPPKPNKTCDAAAFLKDLGDTQCIGLNPAPSWFTDATTCCAACAAAGPKACPTWHL